MKKHIFILVLMIILPIVFNVFVIAKTDKETEDITTTKEQVYYLLGDYNGRIAVFETERKQPLKVYEVFTSSLPYNDAQTIRKGIKITEEELNKYICDYMS